MNEYDGLYAGAHARNRRKPHRNGHTALARAVGADQQLTTTTHIPGDLSSAEVERRYQAALRAIRSRRDAPAAS